MFMCLVSLCNKKYRKNKTENETGYLQGRDGNWGEKRETWKWGRRNEEGHFSYAAFFLTVESQNQDNISHTQNVNDGNKQDMEGSPKQNTNSNKWAYGWAYVHYK